MNKNNFNYTLSIFFNKNYNKSKGFVVGNALNILNYVSKKDNIEVIKITWDDTPNSIKAQLEKMWGFKKYFKNLKKQ